MAAAEAGVGCSQSPRGQAKALQFLPAGRRRSQDIVAQGEGEEG